MRLLLIRFAVALGLLHAAQAQGCTFSYIPLETMINEADLIVIGTLHNLQANTATLTVDEWLKGNAETGDLLINNRQIGVGGNLTCGLVLGNSQRFVGPRFEGIPIVAFLRRDSFNIGAVWIFSGPQAEGWMEMKADEVIYQSIDRPPTPMSLEVFKQRVAEVSGGEARAQPEAPAQPNVSNAAPSWLLWIGALLACAGGVALWALLRSRQHNG